MAKKKSFSIGTSLTQALTDTVNAAKNYSGDLHIEVIPIRKIELDPENPRDFVLQFNDLIEGIKRDDILYDRKNREKEGLASLAHSIKNQGVLNPIIVYKFGDLYRLVAGERRILASIITGKTDIPARILESDPNQLKLSLLQWIENIEREDLSLWERLVNLEKIFNAYAEHHNKAIDKISATEVSELIGCSLQQGVNYKNLMDAPVLIRNLIKENQIKNIEKAAFISKCSPNIHATIIEACLKGASLKELKEIAKNESSKKVNVEKEGRGRQATRVNFGATKNTNVAKIIIQSVLKDNSFSHLTKDLGEINWNDFSSITEAFKMLIKTLEKA